MNIEYPTVEERQSAIDKACDAALRRKETLPHFLYSMVKEVGWRNLFYDMYDVMAVGVFLFTFLGGFIYVTCVNDREFGVFHAETVTTCVSFVSSPLLYMALFLLTQWKERQSGTYEVKMACKYTANHLIAFRMFAFSLFSVVLNTVYLALLCDGINYNFFTSFSISFSSLFFFSLLLILLLLRSHSKIAPAAFSLGWLLLNGLAAGLAGEDYVLLAKGVPAAVYFVIGVLCVGLYSVLLTNFTTNRKGSTKYAHSS